MDGNRLPFGALLRRWRQHRRMTQMDFALTANTSTRHLSYLETGRAQPSREMVLRLAEHLDLPLRERNALLLAAGFAPAFPERSLGELTAARQAIEQVLEAHKPYPAFAVDRHWNIVLSNQVLPELYVGVSPELLRPPVNSVRLTLHPQGLAPRIVNLAQWRQHVIGELRRQIDARADPGTEALLAEIVAYPAPPRSGAAPAEEGAQCYATPLKIATEAGIVSFLSTITVFGTPTDVILSELALEMLFPADAKTATIVAALTARAGVAAPRGRALAEVDGWSS
jgi:transcriptional regulator with XRE-family HTH domain